MLLCVWKTKMALGQASEEKMQNLLLVLMEITVLRLLTLKHAHVAKNLVAFLG
jgi:hypothetical protein